MQKLKSIDYFLCFAFSSILFIECEFQSKYNNETKIFKIYLNSTFKLPVQKSKTYYFILPQSSCIGCYKEIIDYISSTRFSKNQIAIISGLDKKENLTIITKNKIYFDEKGIIDRLNLNVQNTTIIITAKEKIIDIIPITPENFEAEINRIIKP